jgi:hypothetical protein
LPHKRVGEFGHWKILSSPPEQLRIKFSRLARISGQEFIPAKLAMFGLCGIHIWVWFSLSLLSASCAVVAHALSVARVLVVLVQTFEGPTDRSNSS